MKLSVVVPAKDEEKCIENTIAQLVRTLCDEDIGFEIVVVNDNSQDSTLQIVKRMADKDDRLVVVDRVPPAGFGRAVKEGLSRISGDAVVIFMADLSDDPKDCVRYYRKLEEGYDCVFGSRFVKGSSVDGYPSIKLLINRMGNFLIQIIFLLKNNDITNAFKAYRREVIDAVTPLTADHFNITVEIPLRAVTRKFSYATVPISWHGRKHGISKHRLKELVQMYLSSVLSAFQEKIFTKSERKKNGEIVSGSSYVEGVER